MKRNKQGVSLIVLVITIIVMIILAGAVIISLSNTGIIGKANNAVSESNLKEVQQLATLAWSEAYLDNRGVSDETIRLANIERAVNNTLTNQGIDLSKYDIDVTRKGVTVSIKTASGDNNTGNGGNTDNPGTVPGPGEGTGEQPGSGDEPGTGDNTGSDPETPTPPPSVPEVDEDFVQGPVTGPWTMAAGIEVNESRKRTAVKISDGTNTNYIDVGTVVNYMPEGVGPEGAKYTGEWKILGVDDQNRLLIQSSNYVVSSVTLSSEPTLAEIQNVVKDYKDGVIGVEVRNPRLSDIDAITGYDKYTYQVGTPQQYGLEITYSWRAVEEGEDPDYKPVYSYVYNGETVTGQLSNEHTNGFKYYDEVNKVWRNVPYAAGTEIGTITNTYYTYNPNDYVQLLSIPHYVIMVWDQFWYLEDTAVGLGSDHVHSSIVLNMCVSPYISLGNTYFSNVGIGNHRNYPYGVKAVVTLAENAVLTASTTNPGTYDITLGE